jgi:hypothetical protein
MSETFVTCPGCQRHVRAEESVCPFCAATFPTEAAPSARHTATRAALTTALAVAAGLGLQACYGGPPRPRTYTYEMQHRPGGAAAQPGSAEDAKP